MATSSISKLFVIFNMALILKEPIILSQKWSINDKPRSNKLNECLRCKVLTDSFNTGLDRTSRGKHEGGDTAWEEAKLKSYARSEMRLVEIQESLCSEVKTHQDQCYSLAEEVEQLLENWWLHENYDNLDLYTWLCIENLQYCCPSQHYGEVCTPCPRDLNNQICGGNGECDGDGTRKGNGSCICKRGYTGTNCDECAINFYNTMNECKACHRSCNECHDIGPNACVKCASGWNMEQGTCVDVNECLDSVICKVGQFCINREGSYDCKQCDSVCKTCIGSGPINCTSCKDDSVLWFRKCMSNDHKRYLLTNLIKRAALYFCLCILLLIILRKSKYLASFGVVLISLVLYFIEKSSEISLMDINSLLLDYL